MHSWTHTLKTAATHCRCALLDLPVMALLLGVLVPLQWALWLTAQCAPQQRLMMAPVPARRHARR